MTIDVGWEKVEKTNNPMALAGFILGLISVPLYTIGVLPILAVIFSSVGIGTFRDGMQKNWWMAPAGLTLGIIYLLMYMHAYGHL